MLGIGASLFTSAVSSALTYVKDNLKIYFDFNSSRAKTLEFVGTGSVYFDGTSDSVGYNSAIGSGASTYSISMWVKRDSHGESMYLFDARTDSSDGTGYAYVASGGTTITKSSGTAYVDGVESTTLPLGTWHHVVLSGISLNIHSGLHIGCQWQPTEYEWNGNMCQIGLWNRALSVSEIQNIMHKTYGDLEGSELTHLVSWWALDSSSDTYNDSHSTKHLTNTNTTLQDGIYGNYSPKKPRGFDNAPTSQADSIGSGSTSFNGVSGGDAIDCGASSNIIKSTNTTYVCWVKRTSDTRSYVMSAQRDGGGSLLTLAINSRDTAQDAGEITWAVYDGDDLNYLNTEASVLDINKWHHIAAVVTDGSQKLYVDGVKKTLSAEDQDFGGDPGSQIFTIGAYDQGDQLNMAGNIAQVGVFNAALTQEQIQSISQKTYDDLTTSEKTNLTSWWGLDEVFLGANIDEASADTNNYLLGQIVEDKKGSLTTVLIENFDNDDNWEENNGNGSLSINGDGNLVITASGGSSGAQLKSSVVTLETNTEYLLEVAIAGGNEASVGVRADDSSYSQSLYLNGYVTPNTGASNASPECISAKFTSDGTATGFYLQIFNVNDGDNVIIKSFKLYKIVSGSYGVLVDL